MRGVHVLVIGLAAFGVGIASLWPYAAAKPASPPIEPRPVAAAAATKPERREFKVRYGEFTLKDLPGYDSTGRDTFIINNTGTIY